MTLPLNFKVDNVLGSGGFALVYCAEEQSGVYAAIKKSRISLRVRRTMLRHEARVLQLLQGHPAIPMLFGYQRVPHFEYIAVDRLGQSMDELCKPGHSMKIGTVSLIADQMLSALEHLNKHHIVHRDIKADHILLCPSDPSRVNLIDFGMSRRLTTADTKPVHRYDPIESNCHVGTLNWCSINAHLGYDLRPYDDVESLAYSLLYMLMGNLPWRTSARVQNQEPTRKLMICVLSAKKSFTIPAAIPIEFHDLLNFARTAKSDITDNLAEMRVKISNLAPMNSGETPKKPLDFTLAESVFVQESLDLTGDPDLGSANSDEGGIDEPNEDYSSSYIGWDVDCWDTRVARDKSLTFPLDEASLLDGKIPEIVVIDKDWSIGRRK